MTVEAGQINRSQRKRKFETEKKPTIEREKVINLDNLIIVIDFFVHLTLPVFG